MKVNITAYPASILSVAIGNGPNKVNHHPCLTQVKDCDWRKVCDYLLIFELDAKLFAVLIELKKSLNEQDKGKEQLVRSSPILDYLLAVCRIELQGHINPVIKHVLIAEKSSEKLDKQPIRPRPQDVKETKYKTERIKIVTGTEFPIKVLI